MLDRDYRQQGYYSQLFKKLEEQAAVNKCAFSFSFPNNNALKALQKIHPAAQVAKIPRFVKFYRGRAAADKIISRPGLARFAGLLFDLPLAIKNRKKFSTDNVIPLASFDDRANILWERAAKYFPIANIRNGDYLNWRYANSPLGYQVLGYVESNHLLGYIVLHIDKEQVGHIVDLLAVNCERVLPSLLSAADEVMRPKCDILSCWCLDQGQYSFYLKKQGFFPFTSHNTLAVAASASCPPALKEALLKKNNWFVTIGDSDYI